MLRINQKQSHKNTSCLVVRCLSLLRFTYLIHIRRHGVNNNMTDRYHNFTKNIALQHQQYLRALTEPFTEKQQIIYDWLLSNKVPEQRKYVIIEDELIKAPTNRKTYAYSFKQRVWQDTSARLKPNGYKNTE
jgi:hypothetical protein